MASLHPIQRAWASARPRCRQLVYRGSFLYSSSFPSFSLDPGYIPFLPHLQGLFFHIKVLQLYCTNQSLTHLFSSRSPALAVSWCRRLVPTPFPCTVAGVRLSLKFPDPNDEASPVPTE